MADRAIYREYLELCAFDDAEIDEMMDDWVECCNRMNLTEEDVRISCREWLPSHFELNYLGMRKLFGCFVREAIDLSKAKEYKAQGKKLVYGILPANVALYNAIKKAGGDDVYVEFPDLLMMVFYQCMFQKGGAYFDVAEQYGMTYGARHCALNKMRVGIRLTDLVPTPTVDWAWGTVCDEACKIDEYINCMYDDEWKVVVTRVPHDSSAGEMGYLDEERVKFFAQELRQSMMEIQEITGIVVTPEATQAATEEFMAYMGVMAQLNAIALNADPQPLQASSTLIAMMGASLPMNTGYHYITEALSILLEEVKEDVKNGVGEYPKGAPKVGFFFIPWSIPWVDKMFRDNGVATNLSTAFTTGKADMEPPRYQDPFEMLAEQWLKTSFIQGCACEIDSWAEKLTMYTVDAYVCGFLDYDRWIGLLHKKMAAEVEEQTGLPCFYIEADFYDGRDYSPEALRTRIESICQIIKQKKALKEAATE